MIVTIKPGQLRGSVTVPPSKSLSHRAVIASALAGSGSVLENLAQSQDIDATGDCVRALQSGLADAIYPCRESGSTLRFFMPLALALNGGGVFTGIPYLLQRPMGPYFDLFAQKGVSAERTEAGISLRGTLPPGDYPLPGNVSSQFFTGFLFALPLLDGNSRIVLTSPLESKSYVDLTLQVLTAFGISVNETADGYEIPGCQAYKPCRYSVEGDDSQAAFWLVANALGSDIACKGTSPYSIQGDRVMRDLIEQDIREIDVRDCPDLVPVLTVLCCFRKGESKIINAARLRLKECDRLNAITSELTRLGADITELPDGLVIRGVDSLRGGTMDTYNDHRIAMALAIAATRCTEPVTINGAECVGKSYPAFWDHYSALGGVIS